jgi:hypothetical protein
MSWLGISRCRLVLWSWGRERLTPFGESFVENPARSGDAGRCFALRRPQADAQRPVVFLTGVAGKGLSLRPLRTLRLAVPT